MDGGLQSIESQRVRHNWTRTHARAYGVSSLSLCLPYLLGDVSCLSSLWRPASPQQESPQAGVKAPSELISHSRQCPFRGSSTDLTTAPDGLRSLWLVRQWLSFSPGISARGWYFTWLQEIQLHQSSLTKGSILIQGVYGWYSRADLTIQRTWFFSSTRYGIFCPQSGKIVASASASGQTCSQKEQAQKGRQDGTSIAKAKPTHRASSTTSWSYAYPSYKKHSTIQYFTWVRCCDKQNCNFVSNEEGTNANELMTSSTCHMSWGEFAVHFSL